MNENEHPWLAALFLAGLVMIAAPGVAAYWAYRMMVRR